ncbi:MAG: hypothetical protein R3D98_05050 [Candidatus Krumholzibacteriia bacterium]
MIVKSLKVLGVALVACLVCGLPQAGRAAITEFFNPSQVATLVEEGPDYDTISCQGFLFTYTRDKFFTGGGSDPIGRPVRVAWPEGIEAQYVTAGPNPRKAEILVRRIDGQIFDLTAFTVQLLANAGAGRAIEIVPMLNGEEPLNDPLYFDVSGYYGQYFSYDTSPNPNGSTAELVDYDAYKITLTLDFALTALTLNDQYAPVSVEIETQTAADSELFASPNPAGSRVQISFRGAKSATAGQVSVYSIRGVRVRSFALGDAGNATWDLCDEGGRPVPAGIYFVREDSRTGPASSRKVAVVR